MHSFVIQAFRNIGIKLSKQSDPGIHELGIYELGIHELGIQELGIHELGIHELGIYELGIQELGIMLLSRSYWISRGPSRDVNVFIFQKNDRFVMITTTKKNYRLF